MAPLLILLIAFAALRFLVVLANLVTRQWLRPHPVTGNPTVSILIPARNEEENISGILTELIGAQQAMSRDMPQDKRSGSGFPQIIEILVYDDQSTDRTIDRIRQVTDPSGLIRVIDGQELPEGWLGKNHACHRLALEAGGDWLLFLDADVQISRALIPDAIGYAQKKRLRLLSLFPKQVMKSRGEWLVVPLMNWILVSLLPLILVRTCRWTSFSGANGQFMLFDATIYKRFHWHEQVKSDPVEDIRISRLMKKKRFRTATLLSAGQVSCRMYGDSSQAINGFVKNIGQFFGNSIPWMILFVMLTTLLPLVAIPGFLVFNPDGILLIAIYLFLVLLIRAGTSLLSRQNVLLNLLYWFPQLGMLVVLAWKSIRFRSGRKIDWKGRPV